MPFTINITGPADNQSRQKHGVYCNHSSYPSSLTWKVDLGRLELPTEKFFENLFLSAEANGGNSYFYPRQDGTQTLCRFEWHLPWRNSAAAVRVGVVFDLMNKQRPTVATGYFATNEMFSNTSDEQKIKKISGKKLNEVKDFLSGELRKANLAESKQNLSTQLHVYYVSPPSSFVLKDGFAVQNGAIKFLPSMMYEGKHVLAVLIKSVGRSRRDSQRRSVETLYLVLALCSLATGALWKEASIDGVPQEVTGKIHRFKISDAHKLYSEKFKAASWGAPTIPKDAKSLIRRLVRQYQAFEETPKKKFREALFAHYGALSVANENKTLAIVGFLASMGSLSKHLQKRCSGKVNCSDCGGIHPHNEVGDRRAITINLQDRLAQDFNLSKDNLDALDSWIKRLYNVHRSQFVHSAQHRFREFNQSTGNDQTSGGPTAAPSDSRIVSKLNEFLSDFQKLPNVSRFLLLDQFKIHFGESIPHGNPPDFTERYTQEAFIGFPTSGWTRVY
ncbi:MAG: hypothetical protein COB08_011085 [Rhodobacteraceae bacterium]|nr:hypothetical protein [Paracoccaceae bacterium]